MRCRRRWSKKQHCNQLFTPIARGNSQKQKLILHPKTFLRREQRAPENATHPKTQVVDRSENLRFRVCCVFGCSLFPSKRAPKTHPKTQHTRKRRFSERSMTCVSGVLRFRVLFGACQVLAGGFCHGAFCSF